MAHTGSAHPTDAAMLTLTFFGQACTSIKCRRTGVEIVSDPWFSGSAHLNSWHSYPSWAPEELRKIRARIDQATHIYISHNHYDHFDPAFLRTLGRKKILVGDFPNERLRKELKELSALHDIQYVRNGQIVTLHEKFSVQLFLQQPAFRTDSMMLCVAPDATILNANDCGMDLALLRGLRERNQVTVFLYTLNFMANGYPISYMMSADPTLSVQMKAVRDQTVDGFLLATEALKPTLSAAFAGPVTFGDAVNNHLNQYPESIDWTSMLADVRKSANVVWPAPFSTIEFNEGKIAGSHILDWKHFSVNGMAGAVPTNVPSKEEIQKAAGRFVERLSSLLDEAGQETGTRLVLAAVSGLDQIESESPDWVLELDLKNRTARWIDRAVAPYLQITSLPAYLLGLLTNEINSDDILLSARARFKRDPDTFDSVLHDVLRYGGDPLARSSLVGWAKRRKSCAESIAITVGQTPRRIPKFCPHEGECLEGAPVVDGKLVCQRHHWKFDLDTGQCVAGDRSVNLYSLVEQPDS